MTVRHSTYRGTDKARSDLRKIRNGAPKEFRQALYQEISQVEVPECRKRCPKDTELLSTTIRATDPGNTLQVYVVAGEQGSGAEEYAMIQHEDPDLNHPNGGEWKYIENPLKEAAPHMPARIAARIDLRRAKQEGKDK